MSVRTMIRKLTIGSVLMCLAGDGLCAAAPDNSYEGLSKALGLVRGLRSRLATRDSTPQGATLTEAHVATALEKIEDALADQGRVLRTKGHWAAGAAVNAPVMLGYTYRRGREIRRESVGRRWKLEWQTMYPVPELTTDVLLRRDSLSHFEVLVSRGFISDLSVGAVDEVDVGGEIVEVVSVGFVPRKTFYVTVHVEKDFDRVTFNQFRARTVHHVRCFDWWPDEEKTQELGRDTKLRVIGTVAFKNPAAPHSTPMPFGWIWCSDEAYEPK